MLISEQVNGSAVSKEYQQVFRFLQEVVRIVALVRCCPKDYRSVEKEKVYEKETLRNQSVPPLDSLK